jgi:hypothetical protein
MSDVKSMSNHCPVSNEELGGMGPPVVMNWQGNEVKLCCEGCVASFNEDPAKYVAIVKEWGQAPTTAPAAH